MSAYLVDSITIDRFLSGYSRSVKDWKPIEDNKLSEIGKGFLKLNRKAVNYRYNEKQRYPEYAFKKVFNVPLSWSIKAGNCLKYQCSEGNFDKTKVYKEIEEYLFTLAMHLINNMAEYDAAPWG